MNLPSGLGLLLSYLVGKQILSISGFAEETLFAFLLSLCYPDLRGYCSSLYSSISNTNPFSQTYTTTMSRFFRQAGDSDSDSESSDEELMSSEDEAPKAAAKPAMSRFLRTGADSDSSDDSDSDSEDESEMSDDEKGRDTKAKSRFIHNSDSEDDDSDEDVKRVVKSAQAKRLEEMEASGKLMDNALKINDWVAISTGVWTVSFLPVALLTR